MQVYKSVEWHEPAIIRLLDQKRLPHELKYIDCTSVAEIVSAIQDMTVRGAPVIGVTAAYGVALAVILSNSDAIDGLLKDASTADSALRASRPTAINLFWALDEIKQRIQALNCKSAVDFKQKVLAAAHALAEQDSQTNKNIGLAAMELLPKEVTFLHHCNTGGLATVGYGTALGIIRMAHEKGHKVNVFVDETRPRLQGAKLTSWELKQLGISHSVIVDGASGYVMRNKKVDLCVVGCDRVASNGDTANKIGTYNLAVVAYENNVTWSTNFVHPVKPLSSFH